MNNIRTMKQSRKLTDSEKWAEVLNRPAIEEMPSDIQMLVDDVARIGYEHARSVDAYSKDLLERMSYWSARPRPQKVRDELHSCLKEDRGDYCTNEIIQYYNLWTFADNQKKRARQLNTTYFLIKPTYNWDWTNPTSVTPASRESELDNMSRMIPLSYVFYGTLFFGLSLVFGITFYYGIQHDAGFIVGPWTHLMLFVGAVGLTATAVAAVIDWVKLKSCRN